jgi:hypothetical protein
MYRWHKDFKVAYRECLERRRMCVNDAVRYAGDEQVGRFRKVDAHDCGKPRCGVCHYAKYPNRELHEHEILSDLSFKEQLREFFSQDD